MDTTYWDKILHIAFYIKTLETRVVHNPIKVDVLLATYNGEKYLNELLKSLSEQKGVDIYLIVGDDGSSDGTLDILDTYSTSFRSVNLIKFNRIGPSLNFINLLKYSNNKYIAFCDQDDIWDEFHLIKSILRLSKSKNPICITYSKVSEFIRSGEELRTWPNFKKTELRQILVENPARGCSMVFTGGLRDLVKEHPPSFAIMHDWWILIIAWTCGEVVFEDRPEIWYRLHDGNYIGNGKKGLEVTLQTFKKGYWNPLIQAEEILICFGSRMDSTAKTDLDGFVNGINAKLRFRIAFLMRQKIRMRNSLSGEVKLLLGIILFPVIFRNQNMIRNSLLQREAKYISEEF